METTVSSFEHALEHEGELTERQRDVLRLIGKGHTNREIAEMLDISVDGVKWHVREVLSKLGFESRDDAALFWEWKRRPVRRATRWLRGLLVAPAFKVGAGGVAALSAAAVVAVGVMAFLPKDESPLAAEDDAGVTVENFYVEAWVEVEGAPSSTIRWWYRDQQHWRQEFEGASHLWVIADGETLWTYDIARNSYQQASIDEYAYRLPVGQVVAMAMSARLGPTGAEDIDTLMDELLAINTAPSAWARVAGEDTMLGERATIIETGPAWSSEGSQGPQESGGGSRLWVLDDMTIARWELSGMQDIVAEVTAIERNVAIPDERVTFVPPPDAMEEAQGAPGNPSGHEEFVALRPADLPEGFRMVGGSRSPGRFEEHWFGPAVTDKDRIPLKVIRWTARDSLGSWEMAGEPAGVGEHDGYLFEDGEQVRVVWSDGASVWEVVGLGLTAEEVMVVADSVAREGLQPVR